MQLLPALRKDEEARLRVAAVAMEQHRRAKAKAAKPEKSERELVVRLQLDMWGPPKPIACWVRRLRRKPGPAPKRRLVVADVFSLAQAPLRINVGRGAAERQIRRQVIREDGVTRVVHLREQDTEEWQERERQRRARQRPPRPPRSAKTRSRKLQDLIGGDDGE